MWNAPPTILNMLVKFLAQTSRFLKFTVRQLEAALGTCFRDLLESAIVELEVSRDFEVIHPNHCGTQINIRHLKDCELGMEVHRPCASENTAIFLSCTCAPTPNYYVCVHTRRAMRRRCCLQTSSLRIYLHAYGKLLSGPNMFVL